MTAAPSVWAVLSDLVWCLGIGCLLAAGRDLMGLVWGEGPVRRFCLDLLGFAAAAVLVVGFSTGVSAGGLARWYMTGGVAAGAAAWCVSIRPAVHSLLRGIGRILLWPFGLVERFLLQPCRRFLCGKLQKIQVHYKRKKVQKKPKNGKKQLQKPSKILYN